MSVDRAGLLLSCFKQGVLNMTNRYRELCNAFASVLTELEELQRHFVSLKIAHVSARTESARIIDADRFGSAFDEVSKITDEGRENIYEVSAAVKNYLERLSEKRLICGELRADVDRMGV